MMLPRQPSQGLQVAGLFHIPSLSLPMKHLPVTHDMTTALTQVYVFIQEYRKQLLWVSIQTFLERAVPKVVWYLQSGRLGLCTQQPF